MDICPAKLGKTKALWIIAVKPATLGGKLTNLDTPRNQPKGTMINPNIWAIMLNDSEGVKKETIYRDLKKPSNYYTSVISSAGWNVGV